MARRNERKPVVREKDIKRAERGVNIFVKLACLAAVCYFVYLESSKPGSVNILAWAFVFGGFFGKEVGEKFLSGGRG